MNTTATRRLIVDQQVRLRLKRRVAEAAARAAAHSTGPCQCPACTLLRAIKEAGEDGLLVKAAPSTEPPAGVRH